uniref:NADH-ubiquinone oxidoreductase chain 6 n=1 Tax=Pygmaeconus traillii TaxID=1917173 RepID=A0A1L3N1X3_9COND|nr:NADH dehydrogenase subunit 6 [Pygmaeconus traillii]
MSSLIIFSMTMSMLSMLPLMAQPLSLGLVIILSTLLMCLVGAMTLSSWYSYILFLIYVGGLLVMFAYVAALSPNVLFGQSVDLFFIFGVLISMILFSNYMLIDPYSSGNFLSNEQKILKGCGIELVSNHMISVLIGLVFILLINLIVVVKICYYQHASLRPFM